MPDILSAHRKVDDRQFGVVNIQPGFQQSGSGFEVGHKQLLYEERSE
jgi:hypothetical protein